MHHVRAPRATRPLQAVTLVVALLAALLATTLVSSPAGADTTVTYSNNATISVPDSGSADPYPSTIDVSGAGSPLTRVEVVLQGVSHSCVKDLDILLVGPAGTTTTLMSDVGNVAIDTGCSDINANITFSDACGEFGTSVPGGSDLCFRPSDNDRTGHQGDNWPGVGSEFPALNLSTFNGTDPNGAWKLYVVDDSGSDSGTIAGWSLRVTSQNGAPVGVSKSVDVNKGVPTVVTLDGNDPDGDSFTCTAPNATVSGKGTLTGTGCSRTFTAAPGSSGTDSFTFTLTDPGGLVGAPATITFNIVNREPNASPQVFDVYRGVAQSFTLAGTDPDGDPLTCEAAAATDLGKGTLTGTGCARTYTPNADASGTDELTFTISDGTVSSGSTKVVFNIVNRPATATPQVIDVNKGVAKAFTLGGIDADGDVLTCNANTETDFGKGVLTGTGCNRTFKAAPRATGTDELPFTVSEPDGTPSSPAKAVFNIVNRPPTAVVTNLTVGRNERTVVALGGTDPDPGEGVALSCSPTLGATTRGSVSGAGCSVTYAAGNTNGADSFEFLVSDGFGGIATGVVNVTVADPVLPGCTTQDSKNARYVCRVYLDLLNRTAEAGGKAYWVARLDSGESRVKIIQTYQRTPEYRRTVVDDVYRVFLNRVAEPSGRQFWAEQILRGANPDQIRASVIGSSEYLNRAGGTSEGFAAALYQQVLRRPATSNEIGLVVNQIRQGVARSTIGSQLLATVEGDRSTVAGIYERYLRRTPPSDQTEAWVAQLQRGVTELKLVEQIIASSEYFNRA